MPNSDLGPWIVPVRCLHLHQRVWGDGDDSWDFLARPGFVGPVRPWHRFAVHDPDRALGAGLGVPSLAALGLLPSLLLPALGLVAASGGFVVGARHTRTTLRQGRHHPRRISAEETGHDAGRGLKIFPPPPLRGRWMPRAFARQTEGVRGTVNVISWSLSPPPPRKCLAPPPQWRGRKIITPPPVVSPSAAGRGGSASPWARPARNCRVLRPNARAVVEHRASPSRGGAPRPACARFAPNAPSARAARRPCRH